MQELLRRFEPFSGLEPSVIHSVARLSSLVRFPAGRWLLRPGRNLNHHLFLLRGRVRAISPDADVRGGSSAARQPLYPGHGGLQTRSEVEMVRIGSSELEFLLNAAGQQVRCEEEIADQWQLRFLRSHMMAALPMSCWQGLLRVLEPLEYEAGADVILEGDCVDTDHCFILASGHGLVHRLQHRRRKVLRRLGPGDFFGEDALVTNRPRNASITLTEAGRVMRLTRSDFQRFLQQALLAEKLDPDSGPGAQGYSDQRMRRLRISETDRLRERLQCLDPCCGYRIEGSDEEAVDLAVFLLRQRGIAAHRL
jgi:CRP-like cAMP-binding protein